MRWIILATLATLVPGCASHTWEAVDGKPLDPRQLQVAQTICQGEMQKANLEGDAGVLVKPGWLDQVYTGCMAQHGFLDAPQQ
jgi:hypothetical protein